MAELLIDEPVKMGYVIPVKNTKRKRAEAHQYQSLQIENIAGKEERCVLFTLVELDSCLIVDITWELKPGRLYPYYHGRFDGYMVQLMEYDAEDKEFYKVVRLISISKLTVADQRAKRQPEDNTKKSFWEDLKD